MSSRLKTLILLTVALIAVLAYALSPYDFSNDGNGLRKVNLSALKAPTAEEQAAAKILAKKAAVSPKPKQQVTDTCKQTFLFFGDSMLEGLTRRFDDYAGFNGHTLHTVIWYSSVSEKWAKTKTLEHYIAKYHPTFIVVCLCSNELFVRDLDVRDKYIATIVQKIGNIPFVWISPPNWKEDTGINDLIIKHVGKDRYFDSRQLTLERGKDHAHPTFSAAAHWFDLVASWMSSKETAHPIIMKQPDKNNYRAASVEVLQPSFEGVE